jgi:DNA-binding HxlR family transcriptional regulator
MSGPASRRSYGDPCGIARALDLLGERWAFLVIRELILGPKRFTDLRTGLPNVTPDVLAQRLRDLEDAGVVRRDTLPPPASARVYELTEWGHEIEPVVLALGQWGSRAPFPREHGPLGTDAFVIALKTLFDPSAAAGVSASISLRLDGQTFRARVTGRRFELERGSAEQPDAVIETDPASLSAVLWHGRRLSGARNANNLKIRGSLPVVERFLKLFPAPKPAPDAEASTRS